jgi:hypothetical protein
MQKHQKLVITFVATHAIEDLVHALGAEGRLDQVTDGHGADKGRETSGLGFFFISFGF